MNVLIVCHAGNGVGLGHLTRAIVIANAMQHELFANIYFIIQGESAENAYSADFDHAVLNHDQDLMVSIKKYVDFVDVNFVIFDLHPQRIPDNFKDLLTDLRRKNIKIVGIDGLLGFQNSLDLVFIPSFNRTLLSNQSFEVPVLYGWDCYLLNVQKKPIDWSSGNRVLVLTGGSDTTNLANILPANLDSELAKSTELNWVTGPFAKSPVIRDYDNINFINHLAPSGLDDLMITSNYALTVYGVSFFELLYYGVPTVVFSPYGGKDRAELEIIESEGVAIVAKDCEDAVFKLKELMLNNNLALSISCKARQKLSVRGEYKFTSAVSDLVAQV